MALGKWISNLKGLFSEGPMKELTELVDSPQEKLSAERVVITNEFRETFSVAQPVSENLRNSFLFSMLVMASYIVMSDGKVLQSEYSYLAKFLNENFGSEAEHESMEVVSKLISKNRELAERKPMAFVQLIGNCGSQIAQNLNEELRYQMLSMLAMIVKADDDVDAKEVEALKDVAVYIGMKTADIDVLMAQDIEQAKQGWQWINK